MTTEFTVEHDHTYGSDPVQQLIGWVTASVSTRPGDFRVRELGGPTPRALNIPTRRGWLAADGHMYKDQSMEEPFRLIANVGFNLRSLTYHFDFELTTPLGVPVPVPRCSGPAPSTDTTLYLTKLMNDMDQPVMEVRTKGYAEDILDATGRGVAILTGDETDAREAIDADTYAAYFANRNGSTDDRAIMAAADAAAVAAKKPLMLLAGVHKVNSNLTITSPVAFRPGAIIKPASGVTVILAGGIVGNDGQFRVFDQSLGGKCIPKNVPGLHPGWWGPILTEDDSQTWIDMVTACEADTEDQPYKQRIFVPAGDNRLWEVTIRNFHMEGNGRSSRILPPDTASAGDPVNSDTGYIVKLRSTTTVSGVDFDTNNIPGITAVFYTGSEGHLSNGRVLVSGAGSIGVWAYTASGSITPKLSNVSVEGTVGMDFGVGIVIDSYDFELMNCWIYRCTDGIQLNKGSGIIHGAHIWGCTNNGITANYVYGVRLLGCYIENNDGWGAYFNAPSHLVIDSTTTFWKNGLAIADTGGLKLRTNGSAIAEGNRIDATFDDNYGTGFWMDHVRRTTGDMRVVSSKVSINQDGGPLGTDGVYIGVNTVGTDIRVRTSTGATLPVTGKVVNNQAGVAAQVDFPAPYAGTAVGGTGAENGAGTWSKLATFTSSAELSDLNVVYAFTANYGATAENGILSVRLRNNASGADPSGDVQVLAIGGRAALTPDSFKLVFGALGDPFELWVRKNVDYLDVKLAELISANKTAWVVNHSLASAWQSATPTGSVGNVTSIKPDLPSSSSTVTSAGTLTMTIRDAPIQIFTGSSAHTVKLPTTGVKAGARYLVISQSSGAVTVQSSAANTIGALYDGSSTPVTRQYVALQDSPTAANHWRELFSLAPAKSSTVTSAGTLTLTIGSAPVQEFTGSTTHTVKLPTTGVTMGQSWTVINNSTGVVTVQSSDGTTILAVQGSRMATFAAKADTPTTGSHWGVPSASASTSASAANTLVMRDVNSNVSAVNFFTGKQSTTSAAGTLTLGNGDYRVQVVTGSTTHTVKLPTTGVTAGMEYRVISQSTGDVTVQSSGSNTVSTLTGGSASAPVSKLFVALVDTPTTAAHWLAA